MSEKTDVIAASMIGTIIEWYGIFIFASGAIYIERTFYPSVSVAEGLLLTLLTFALGFITRPVGAYVFGHFGDRLGRKRILLLTLLISGISTGLTGLIPSEASIGAMAIVLLVVLRLALGFGLGGEWGGAMLLTLETFKNRRGFYSSFVQSTVGIGLLLGILIFIPLVYALPSSFMYSIGWRIPFLASFVIVVVGVFIRLKVKETPVFEAEKKKELLSISRDIETIIHKREIDEIDINDDSCNYSYAGGFYLMAKKSGSKPSLMFEDTFNPSRPQVRTMKEEIERTAIGKLLNEKWIAAQKNFGYRGATEMLKKIEHLYGWGATTKMVNDNIFNNIAEKFVLDKEMKEWFKKENPWALSEITSRMIEAYKRDIWHASESMKEQLEEEYMEIEGENE